MSRDPHHPCNEDLVRCQDLCVTRGGFRLQVPDWRVPTGAVIGLVGPNGAGKTTLLELLHGRLAATSGHVRVLGHDPALAPVPLRSTVGFMSDELPVWDMRLDRLLHTVSGYYADWDHLLVDRLIQRFGLNLRDRVHSLSKGQGSRLRLVLALAFRPRLLLLDEPASGLDLDGRRQLLRTVLEFVQEPDRSVIVSSHALWDVERLADALLVLHRGSVVRSGPTDELVGDERTLEEAMLAWGAT